MQHLREAKHFRLHTGTACQALGICWKRNTRIQRIVGPSPLLYISFNLYGRGEARGGFGYSLYPRRISFKVVDHAVECPRKYCSLSGQRVALHNLLFRSQIFVGPQQVVPNHILWGLKTKRVSPKITKITEFWSGWGGRIWDLSWTITTYR